MERMKITWEEYFGDMCDEDLVEEAKSLHRLIEVFECFGVHDLIFYEKTLAELDRRGFNVNFGSTIFIDKPVTETFINLEEEAC